MAIQRQGNGVAYVPAGVSSSTANDEWLTIADEGTTKGAGKSTSAPSGSGTPPPGSTSNPPAAVPSTPTATGQTGISEMLGDLGMLTAYGFTNEQAQTLATWYTNELAQPGMTSDQMSIDLWTSSATKPIMQQVFPGIVAQMEAGQKPMSVSDYVQFQQDVQDFASSMGLPAGFISGAEVGQMVASGMTIQDLSDRISDAQNEIQNANPQALALLQKWYGIAPNSGALAAYALNPNNPLFTTGTGGLENQFEAAKLGGVAEALGYQGVASDENTLLNAARAGATSPTSDFALQQSLSQAAPGLALEESTQGPGDNPLARVAQGTTLDIALGQGTAAQQRDVVGALETRAAASSGGGGYTQTARGSAQGYASEQGAKGDVMGG